MIRRGQFKTFLLFSDVALLNLSECVKNTSDSFSSLALEECDRSGWRVNDIVLSFLNSFI